MNLQVRDFAIVEKIDIEFDAGMTVLTGPKASTLCTAGLVSGF